MQVVYVRRDRYVSTDTICVLPLLNILTSVTQLCALHSRQLSLHCRKLVLVRQSDWLHRLRDLLVLVDITGHR